MIAADQEPCPSCGARLGGRAGCQTMFDQLSTRAWTSPLRGSVHNLVVDTYAMQHPEEYGKSPKSYAAHLTALCAALENPGDRRLYWAISRWLDGRATVDKPPLVDRRGDMTIAGVADPRAEEEFPELVRQWARRVWEAYASQQDLARGWRDAALDHKMQKASGSGRG
jgi:hypothetical protein